MNTTSLSLLDRRKRADPDSAEWHRLQDIYLPLIRRWLGRLADLRDEADDLGQEVLVILFRELPRFERRRDGSFRAWLRQITVNRVWAFRRARGEAPAAQGGSQADTFLHQLADPTSDLSWQWDHEHDQHVIDKLLAVVRPDFEATTWEAFTGVALQGHPVARVAEELGTSVGAVVQAKFRVVKRLREEAGDLLD